jgi:hypothetical protein
MAAKPRAKERRNPMVPVLTVTLGAGHKVNLYMLNPGDHFANFGGSRTGYLCGKTATLIMQECSPMTTHDVACDIFEPSVWQWIAKHINTDPSGIAWIGDDAPQFAEDPKISDL